MAEEILKDISKEYAPQSNHCNDGGANPFLNILTMDAQSFRGTLSCDYKCEGKDLVHGQVKRNFSTSDYNMVRGDGNLWASLSITLQLWGQEGCLANAAKLCDGIEKVEQSELKSVTSGSWSLKAPLKCSEKNELIKSPFDKNIKDLEPVVKNESQNLSLQTFAWKVDKIRHSNEPYPFPKDCKKTITGTLCFGDCITLEGESMDLLQSPAPLASEKYRYCADELVKKISEKKLAPSVRKHYCETYFASQLVKNFAMGLSCAAARFNVDCSSF